MEKLRVALESSETERDVARREATELGARNELISARLAAAEAQIATRQRAGVHYSEELGRVLAEREPLRRDADRGREAKAELERLRQHLDDVERRKRELTDDLRTAQPST